MARHFGREKDVMLLRVRSGGSDGGVPEHRFNLIGDRSIPFATHARCLVDTASSLGNRREQAFFRNAAQIHIGAALALLDALDYEVALDNAAELLTDPAQMREVLAELEQSGRSPELARHFQQFTTQPAEQLGGITGTIRNYLHHFTAPEIAEVFSRDSTFGLDEVDRGKILCLALPQRLQTERRYVGSLLKQLFFLHALRRFDMSERERQEKNLLLFVADEAQHFLSVSEDGQSDHNVVDVLREAGVAFIAATQSSTSLGPVLGAENAKVLLLNLRNRILFTAADEEDARMSAEFPGEEGGVGGVRDERGRTPDPHPDPAGPLPDRAARAAQPATASVHRGACGQGIPPLLPAPHPAGRPGLPVVSALVEILVRASSPGRHDSARFDLAEASRESLG
ncbi:MAG: type IV secretory system conjugative DNA transfer family protein [Verrucomicrobia bacterium]|nr:type IV secretory system conjugative DNA transfer family protein [Verrucomicrobiota bacterium]